MLCYITCKGGSRIFLGGGALVSCSTSTPIIHKVFFFLQNTSCIRTPQVILGEVCTPCTLHLDPPLTCVMLCYITYNMLYDKCHVMLYNICHVMLNNIYYVMLYKK